MRFTNQYKTYTIQGKQKFVHCIQVKYNRYEFHMVFKEMLRNSHNPIILNQQFLFKNMN